MSIPRAVPGWVYEDEFAPPEDAGEAMWVWGSDPASENEVGVEVVVVTREYFEELGGELD